MTLLTTGSGDGSLRVEVDAFGAFGSSVGFETSDAFYDPIGELTEAGTTFQSGIAFRLGNEEERTFLTTGDIGGSGSLTEFDLGTTTDTSVASTFNYEGLDFALTQEVANLFSDEGEISGSNLTQTYTITNPGSETVEFEIIRYIDGDLQFDGSIDDAGGRLIRNGQEILFETDSGDNPDFATTFFGITATGGTTEEPGRFEIDSYSGLRSRIIAGETLDDTVTGDGPDTDEFVDSEPYDLTLALDNSFVLNPGETRTYTTTTIFGSGAPEEFTPPSSGFVIDNYISGATVFFDVNQNGILDENEPNTTTDDSGAYELNIPNSFDTNNNGQFDIEEGVIVASGGTDTATGLPLETPVTALADSGVITLLTSLVTNLVNQGLSVEEANNQVTTALSIPTDIDILTLDPIVATNNNQPGGVETFAAMVKTQNVITQTAALLAGATNSSISEMTDEVVAAITSEIQSSGSLNLTDTQQLETIIEAAATNANADVSQIKDEVALVIAEANQQIDNAVANSSTDSLEEEFANLQKISLDKTTSDLQQAGAGNKSIEDVVADNTGEALDNLIAGIDTPLTLFEPNDTIAEAIDSGINGVGSYFDTGFIGDNANVNPSDDVDLISLFLNAGDRVTVDIDASVFGSQLDSELRLFDSAGVEVAFNDDADSLDSFIDFTAEVSDTYYVGVSSFSNDFYDPFIEGSGTGTGFSTGEYDIFIDVNPIDNVVESNDTIASAIDSGINSTGSYFDTGFIGDNANVNPSDDVDLISLFLNAGDRVTVDIDASVFGSQLDSELRLFDSAGVEVAFNDDADSLDSFIDFTAEVSDTYYVGVSSFSNDFYDPFIEGSGTGTGFSTGEYDIFIDVNPVPTIATDVNGTTVEAIDLTGFASDKVTVDYTISREADFDNQVYFYAVDDITGTVGGVAVGEDGYMEAALNSLVSPVFSTSDDNTETGSLEFDAGSIVVPVIIADGTLNEALSGEAEVYFPYLGANTDDGNFDHIKLLDDKTFGFEDLPNGGDQDFNDIIIEINSIA